MGRWTNNIVRYEPAVDPADLLAHPENWRCHPDVQRQAMTGALDEIGWIDAVTVNDRTGHVIDGHLRVGEAITADETVPVLFVDVDEDTERKALASFDTITGLATVDKAAIRSLAQSITFTSDALTAAVAGLFTATPAGGDDGNAEPETHPLVWGYVQWGQKRKVDSTESEVTSLDAVYNTWVDREGGDDTGFVRWLVNAAQDALVEQSGGES